VSMSIIEKRQYQKTTNIQKQPAIDSYFLI